MNRSIHEWQYFSMKKDIEYIKRSISIPSSSSIALLSEVFVSMLSLFLDKLMVEDTPLKRGLMIALAAVLVGIFLGYCSFQACKYIKLLFDMKNNRQSVSQYIDIYDNDICYYAMTANEFLHVLQSSGGVSPEEKKFYYIEANYYVNKCIALLIRMNSNIDRIVSFDPMDNQVNSNIQYNRLENTVSLLKEIREALYEVSDGNPASETTVSLANAFDDDMAKWVNNVNDKLGEKGNLKWITKTA